jgi:inosine-uridine nucleoside N-ribohydrolase
VTHPHSLPKIILDTDPGGDDTFALLWLLSLVKQGLAELVAVTAADGNVSVQRTFTNSSQILGLAGYSQIPVGRGVVVNDDAVTNASHIHGIDGMGNLSNYLPPASHNWATAPASDAMIVEHLSAAPGEITLVAIGPLTNLAAAETKRPGILRQAKEIVLMAGAFHGPGNVTPHAEFNIWFNPDAAQTVFESRADIVVMPTDVTNHLIFTQAMAEAVSRANQDSIIAQLLTRLCKFMISTSTGYRETSGVEGFLVHDAATLGYLFYPQAFLFQRAKVYVETQGQWTKGQTLIDRRLSPQLDANAWIALQVDQAKLFTNLIEDLRSLL